MTPCTLLIVDDEPMLVDVLRDEFERLGITCLTASQGIEALTQLSTNPVDAVLCDINMPLMNGLDLLIEMRERRMETPLVFLTGMGGLDEAVRALRHGAFDFVTKPYDRETLLKTVTAALKYGVELRTLEAELDAIVASHHFTGHELEKYRAVQRLFLKNRKQMHAIANKD